MPEESKQKVLEPDASIQRLADEAAAIQNMLQLIVDEELWAAKEASDANRRLKVMQFHLLNLQASEIKARQALEELRQKMEGEKHGK